MRANRGGLTVEWLPKNKSPCFGRRTAPSGRAGLAALMLREPRHPGRGYCAGARSSFLAHTQRFTCACRYSVPRTLLFPLPRVT